MDKRLDNGQKKEASNVLDLSDFVTEVDRFSRLIEPFALVFYAIDDIRRWRFRKGTVLLWLLCNAVCIWLTQGAVFVLASSLVIGIATLSLVQIHTQILDKLLPSNKKPTKLSEEEDSGTLDTVHNFRYSLIAMHDFVVKSNEYLSYFYSILKWDAVGPSAIYHIEACVFLLSVVMCPARWNCFLFVNWFFLCHPHIIRKGCRQFSEYWSKVKQPAPQKEQISENKNEKDEDNCEDCCYDDNDSSDLGNRGSHKEPWKRIIHWLTEECYLAMGTAAPSLNTFLVQLDMTDKVADASMISLDPSPGKPGMVARFMEIKKRRKQISSESCQGCKVSFASILKKRPQPL